MFWNPNNIITSHITSGDNKITLNNLNTSMQIIQNYLNDKRSFRCKDYNYNQTSAHENNFHAMGVAAAGAEASLVSDSQKEVFFPVFETVWRTSSGFTLPFTVTFCSLMSTSNDSTPE